MEKVASILLLGQIQPPPDAILQGMDIDMPTPQEIKDARLKMGLSLRDFSQVISAYRCGWEHGERLCNKLYSRQTISCYELGTMAIGKPFAFAFREWQRAVKEQLPPGARFISGVLALCDIPSGALICSGKLVRCQECGQLLLAWPTTRYCPNELSPKCRKEARRRRAQAKREEKLKQQEVVARRAVSAQLRATANVARRTARLGNKRQREWAEMERRLASAG